MRLGKRSEKPPAEERRAEPSAADVYSGKYSGGGASAAAGAPPSQATGLAKGPAARKGLTRSMSFGSKPMRAPPVAENNPAAQNRSP